MMASNSEIQGNLTNYKYVRLGQVISYTKMESIALGYLNIEEGKIEQIRKARREDTEGFVRELIKVWVNRNPHNQVRVGVSCSIFILVVLHFTPKFYNA